MYVGISSIGPGLNREFAAIRSSKTVGFKFFKKFLIPADSNWNKPMVFALLNCFMTFGSFSLIFSMSISISRFFLTSFMVSLITVRFLSPKKSIFSSPNSSISVILYWVTIRLFDKARGTISVKISLLITTPAACIDVWRGRASNFLAVSMSLLLSASFWYASLNLSDSSRALSRVILMTCGTNFAILSTLP